MEHYRFTVLTRFFVWLLLLVVSSGVVAQAPRYIPDPFLRQISKMDEPLDLNLLIRASLILSGVSEANLAGYEEKMHRLAAGISLAAISPQDPYQAGEFILTYLHENLLDRYSERQTRIDVLLSTGTFNCVSSAVVYLILARTVGITVSGVSTKDHAFCLVNTDEGAVDVETTTEHGFDPGRKKQFADSFGNITGYSYVPPGDYGLRDLLGERELLSLILHNRISALEAQNRFAETVPLSVDRYTLAPNKDTAHHLSRAFVNYGALLNQRGAYDEALDMLADAGRLYAFEDEFLEIRSVLWYNRIITQVNTGELSKAEGSLSEVSSTDFLADQQMEELRSLLMQGKIATTVPALTADQGIQYLAELYNAGSISFSTYKNHAVDIYGNKANQKADIGEYMLAADIISDAIAIFGSDSRLLKAREGYLYNFAAEAHNEFAGLFNAGNHDKAVQVLKDALEILPDSSLLLKDLDMVKELLSSSAE